MSAFSKPAKFLLVASAVLLLLAILVSVFTRPTHRDTTVIPDAAPPSSDGWICQWLDTPTLQRGTLRNQCHGVVQCRHPTMLTFVPQIRKVTYPTRGDACDAAACFTRSIGTP